MCLPTPYSACGRPSSSQAATHRLQMHAALSAGRLQSAARLQLRSIKPSHGAVGRAQHCPSSVRWRLDSCLAAIRFANGLAVAWGSGGVNVGASSSSSSLKSNSDQRSGVASGCCVLSCTSHEPQGVGLVAGGQRPAPRSESGEQVAIKPRSVSAVLQVRRQKCRVDSGSRVT